jgi:DNA polymerase III subunit epsilon
LTDKPERKSKSERLSGLGVVDRLREIAIDVETSGFGSKDKILEIAAWELIDRRPTGRVFTTLLDPGSIEIKPEVTEINGLTIDDLRGAPTFGDIRETLEDFVGGSDVVAHNAAFDLRFIQQEYVNFGLDKPRIVGVCTLELAKTLMPGPHKLGDLVALLRPNVKWRYPAHTSMGDVERCVAVYRELVILQGERVS